MTIVIVGNPGNRRVTLFAAAAVAAGLPEPEVVAWRDVAAGSAFRFPAGSLVRVESPGEDPEVDRLLRGAPQPAEHGEIIGGRPWYDGFARALTRIERAAADSGATLLADPDDILVMFDKAVCHRRLLTAGVPVPPALPQEPRDWPELRSWLDEAGWHRVFVKPRHGSSASGVIALQRAPGRVLATTSVERAGPKLFNSLRVRSYRDEREIAAIIDQLAPDGLHVERWFPKASLAGRVIDLRVVMIGGEPSHVVVRSSRHPMTNLHLGGTRGDLRAVQAFAGEHYGAAMRTCRAAAACFPGSRQAGVDLMFGPGWRRHAIAEVNAFGDLLPGLLADGRDTYAAQLAHLAAA